MPKLYGGYAVKLQIEAIDIDSDPNDDNYIDLPSGPLGWIENILGGYSGGNPGEIGDDNLDIDGTSNDETITEERRFTFIYNLIEFTVPSQVGASDINQNLIVDNPIAKNPDPNGITELIADGWNNLGENDGSVNEIHGTEEDPLNDEYHFDSRLDIKIEVNGGI